MQAVLIDAFGGPEHLRIGSYLDPKPTREELLVRVAATALNRADLMQREGRYPPPEGASEILGLEMAGTVVAVGSSCSGWEEGDRVFGLLPGGGYAEYATLHHNMAMRIPPRLNFVEAAAIPEVFLTACQALYWLGGLQEGERVLVHAGASGVGTAALQFIEATGATAYVTASSPKHDLCLQLGARAAIDYRSEDFAERIAALTDGEGVHLILDFIGAPYFERNIASLTLDGRLVLLSMMGGSRLDAFSLSKLFRKRAHVMGTTLRNRTLAYKIELTRHFATTWLPSFEDGTLVPIIDKVFDWQEVEAAHRYMEANKNAGKIVLRVSE